MQDLAAEKGGLCLSDNYVDALTKLRWQCSKNHIWEATPETIINGSWCPECARARRYTIEGMAELAAEQGVTLTVEQVRQFLQQMNEDSEFDDIELDSIALAAIAGGQGAGHAGC